LKFIALELSQLSKWISVLGQQLAKTSSWRLLDHITVRFNGFV